MNFKPLVSLLTCLMTTGLLGGEAPPKDGAAVVVLDTLSVSADPRDPQAAGDPA